MIAITSVPRFVRTSVTKMGEELEDFQLVIIGAGPCGLAILARMVRDATCGICPADSDRAQQILQHTLVIDPDGWLAAWRRKLNSQGVSHLRSPTFVHPHPSRPIDDVLLRYANAGRLRELLRLPGTRGGCSDGSQAPDHSGDWSAPAARLFDDFCAEILQDAADGAPSAGRVRIAKVHDIRPPRPPQHAAAPHATAAGGPSGQFELQLSEGPPILASRVVLAVGDGGVPRLPAWYAAARAQAPHLPLRHASELAALDPSLPLKPSGSSSGVGSAPPPEAWPRADHTPYGSRGGGGAGGGGGDVSRRILRLALPRVGGVVCALLRDAAARALGWVLRGAAGQALESGLAGRHPS